MFTPMRLFAWYLLCALLTCCSATEPRYSVGTVFSPGPGLEESTGKALARLSAATGIRFTVGPGGVPIEMLPEVIGPAMQEDGTTWDSPVCAVTPITYTTETRELVRVEIDVAAHMEGCWEHSYTIEHEVIHALRAALTSALPVDEQMRDHTATGVFRAYSDGSTPPELDGASLSKVCEAVNCAVFAPEE